MCAELPQPRLTLSSAEPQQSWKARAELGPPELRFWGAFSLSRSLGQSLSLGQHHLGVRYLCLLVEFTLPLAESQDDAPGSSRLPEDGDLPSAAVRVPRAGSRRSHLREAPRARTGKRPVAAGEFVRVFFFFVLVMIESWCFMERCLLWPNVTSCCDVAMAKPGNIWSNTSSLQQPPRDYLQPRWPKERPGHGASMGR